MRVLRRLTAPAAFLFAAAAAAQPALPSGLVWERKMGEEARRYRPSAMAPAADGVIVAGSSTLAAGGKGLEPQFWLWRIDAKGTVVESTDLPNLEHDHVIDVNYPYVRDLTILKNGDVVVVMETPVGHTFLVVVGEHGVVKNSPRLLFAGLQQVHIDRVVPETNESFIAVGRAARDGLVARVDLSGKVMQAKTFDSGDADAILDVARSGDQWLVLGRSGILTPFFVGEHWIGEIGPTAEVVVRRRFPARRAAFAVGGGAVAVISDRSFSQATDVWVEKWVGSDRAWQKKHTADPHGLEAYPQIAGVKDGFTAASTEGIAVHLTRYDAGGVARSAYNDTARDAPFHSDCVRLVSAGELTYALTSVMSESAGHVINTKVGLISFR